MAKKKKDVFDLMGESWGRPAVARTEMKKFSGGRHGQQIYGEL